MRRGAAEASRLKFVIRKIRKTKKDAGRAMHGNIGREDRHQNSKEIYSVPSVASVVNNPLFSP
jgi:hypothetical protein